MNYKKTQSDTRKSIDLVPPEKLELNTYYTLNINPYETLYSQSVTLKEKIAMLIKYVQELLYYTDVGYQLYPELSKVGKLHVHGLIKFYTPESVMEVYNNIYNTMGKIAIEIDTIDNIETYLTYCKKQSKFMKPYCKSANIKYLIVSNEVKQGDRGRE